MFGRRRKTIARGQTVHLFAPGRDSTDEFVAMTSASVNFHHPWVYPATDHRRFRHYIERLESGGSMGYFIGRNDDDTLVGVININDIVRGGFKSGSLGYYVGAAYAGRGYMTEGLSLVLD